MTNGFSRADVGSLKKLRGEVRFASLVWATPDELAQERERPTRGLGLGR